MTSFDTGWAPVIHGRTYRVDFRPQMMAIPTWFTEDHIEMVRPFVLASTRSAETIPAGCRWLFVKTDSYQVVGVTCMASDVSADMTHDRPDPRSGGAGRPLYTFLGWATCDLSAEPPPMELDYYQQLYEFIRKRWDTAPPDDVAEKVSAMVEKFPSRSGDFRAEELNRIKEAFSKSKTDLSIWPESFRDLLWASAADYSRPVSLCLGMARSRDAEKSPLGHITLSGRENEMTIHRGERTTTKTVTPEKDPFDSSPLEPGQKSEPRHASHFPYQESGTSENVSYFNRLFQLLAEPFKRKEGPDETTAQEDDRNQVEEDFTVKMGDLFTPLESNSSSATTDAFDAFNDPPPDTIKPNEVQQSDPDTPRDSK